MKRERKNNVFTSVPVPKVRRNLFDLSHEVKMSGKFGLLYPILCEDTMPGDVFRCQTNVMVRFAPLLAPIMHRVDVTVHYFFVPFRIICDAWQDFITGGRDGTEEPVLPYVTPAGIAANTGKERMQKGSLWDYFGLPLAPDDDPSEWSEERISVLPFRAFGKIWNDYYRDPNLQDELDLETDVEGDVSSTFGWYDYQVAGGAAYFYRMWEKDYFTSALPWAQRGPSVLMPFSAVVDEDDITYKAQSDWYNFDGTNPGSGGVNDAQFRNVAGVGALQNSSDNKTTRVENIEGIEVSAASTTINDFRRALAIQRWLENNARGGARYTEQILNHFNVQVPDYRLQRAEYLGGGKQPVQISEVLATAETEEVPVGDMMGHGLSVGRTNQFTYRCAEHGVVIGVLSVVPRTAYQQGIKKFWLKNDKFDFGFPELANLGEQEILSKELFFSFDKAHQSANDSVFGYIPRYAEYKFSNDRVAGDFRDNLAFWHLGRIFKGRPTLSSLFTTFLDEDSTINWIESFTRIFAVEDGTDYLWMQLYHRLTVLRPLPYFGVPKIV